MSEVSGIRLVSCSHIRQEKVIESFSVLYQINFYSENLRCIIMASERVSFNLRQRMRMFLITYPFSGGRRTYYLRSDYMRMLRNPQARVSHVGELDRKGQVRVNILAR